MASELPLRAALVRGALVTLANWPVVLIEFAVESLYKLALVVPVVGGALIVSVLAGGDLRLIFAEGVQPAAGMVVSALTGAPIALTAFIVAVVIVAVGGALMMFMLKAGTLSVLVAGERLAPDVERLPASYALLTRIHSYSIDTLLTGIHRFGRRSMVLSLILGVAYAFIGVMYLMALGAAVRLSAHPGLGAAWPLLVAASTGAAIIAIAAVNVAFDLMRIIVVVEDCSLAVGASRLWAFLIADTRQVVGIFAVVTALFALAFAASLLVATGLALVAWVPVVGLVVIPLQAAAWLIRGLVFQYMAASALVAYQTQYSRFRAFVANRSAQPPPADRLRHLGAR